MAWQIQSPLLWKSLPFQSEDAYLGWLRDHMMWHRELAVQIQKQFKVTVPLYELDDLKENLRNHAIMHDSIAKAINVTNVADLQSFDLNDAVSWVAFHDLHADDHQRFRAALGV